MKKVSIILLLNWHFLAFSQISTEMSRAFQVSLDSTICLERKVASIDFGWEDACLNYFIKIINCTDKSIEYSISREINTANIFADTGLKYSFNKFGDVLIFCNSTKLPFCDDLPKFTKQIADSLHKTRKYALLDDFYNYNIVVNYVVITAKLNRKSKLKFEQVNRYYYQYRFAPPYQRPIKFVDTPFFRIDSTLCTSDFIKQFEKYFPKGKTTPEYYEERFVFKIGKEKSGVNK